MNCKKCGNELEENWKCCPKCGTLVDEQKEQEKERKEKNKDKRYLVEFIIFIVAFVIMFFIQQTISIVMIILAFITVVTGNMKCPDSKAMKICLWITIGLIIIGLIMSMVIWISACGEETDKLCGSGTCEAMSSCSNWADCLSSSIQESFRR